MKKLEEMILELGKLAYRSHFWVDEDNWYSCPKAPDGCCNDAAGTECNCGAYEHNAKVAEIVEAALKENEWSNNMEEILSKAAIIDGTARISYPNILK